MQKLLFILVICFSIDQSAQAQSGSNHNGGNPEARPQLTAEQLKQQEEQKQKQEESDAANKRLATGEIWNFPECVENSPNVDGGMTEFRKSRFLKQEVDKKSISLLFNDIEFGSAKEDVGVTVVGDAGKEDPWTRTQPSVAKLELESSKNGARIWKGAGSTPLYKGSKLGDFTIRYIETADPGSRREIVTTRGPEKSGSYVALDPPGDLYMVSRQDDKGNSAFFQVVVRKGQKTVYLPLRVCGTGFGEKGMGGFRFIDDLPGLPRPPVQKSADQILSSWPPDAPKKSREEVQREFQRKFMEYADRVKGHADLVKRFPTPEEFRKSDLFAERVGFLKTAVPQIPEEIPTPTPRETPRQAMARVSKAWQEAGGSIDSNGYPFIVVGRSHPSLLVGQYYNVGGRYWRYIGNNKFEP